MCEGNTEYNKNDEPEPATAVFNGEGEEAGSDECQGGHPAPGKLDKAQLREVCPERKRDVQSEQNGRDPNDKERKRNLAIALRGACGQATGGEGGQSEDQNQGKRTNRSDPVEPGVFGIVNLCEQEIL